MGLFCCMQIAPSIPRVDTSVSFDASALQDGVQGTGCVLMPEQQQQKTQQKTKKQDKERIKARREATTVLQALGARQQRTRIPGRREETERPGTPRLPSTRLPRGIEDQELSLRGLRWLKSAGQSREGRDATQ